jgi:deoxyribonuclease V
MNLFEYTYNLVQQIPKGKISTYGAVAKALGDIRAARAVGKMMNQNPHPDMMPCYKIVCSDGNIGGYSRSVDDKIRRLKEDNVFVKDGKIVDFKNVFFDNFETSYPLKKLRREQTRLSRKVDIEGDDFDEIETVAGIDVAYPRNEFDDACGACVVMDYETKQVKFEKTVWVKPFFPYIPTYLFYREYPVIEKLLRMLDPKPTITLLDGNGILHPRRFGLASHAGTVFDIPTIGVAKSLLNGRVENDVVKVDDEIRGYVLFSKRTKKPIYVSPGHKVSLETCKNVIEDLSIYRVPEPLRQAHILARKQLIETR